MSKTTLDAPIARFDLLASELLAGAWRADLARRAALVRALAGRVDSDAAWMEHAIDRALPGLQALSGNWLEFRQLMELRDRLFGRCVPRTHDDPAVPEGFFRRTAETLAEVLAERVGALRRLGRYAHIEAAHACSWIEVTSWYVAEAERPYRAEVGVESVEPLLFFRRSLAGSPDEDQREFVDYGLGRYDDICQCIARLRREDESIDDRVLRELQPIDRQPGRQ